MTFTEAEIVSGLKAMRNNKSGGLEGTPAEYYNRWSTLHEQSVSQLAGGELTNLLFVDDVSLVATGHDRAECLLGYSKPTAATGMAANAAKCSSFSGALHAPPVPLDQSCWNSVVKRPGTLCHRAFVADLELAHGGVTECWTRKVLAFLVWLKNGAPTKTRGDNLIAHYATLKFPVENILKVFAKWLDARLCDCGAVEDELHVFEECPTHKSIRAKYDGDLVFKGCSMRTIMTEALPLALPSSVLQSADCDGDGILDLTCRDDDGRRWAITSSTGCDANAAIWDIVPPSACPKIFSPPTDPASCTRPSGWCIHDTAVLQSADCDGDGILDLTCRDDDGRRWAITSSKGCDANTAIWDIVPPSACPMIFPPPTDPASCTRPSGWCIHNSSVLQSADCDGDGALDVTCRDDDGRRWAITSSTGCDANAAIWDIVPPSACPKIFSPPTDPGTASCTRPSGWCIHNSSVLQSADCDGDGALDVTCRDDDGRRWAITSSTGCDANAAIWDIVPPSACPKIFSPPTDPASCTRPSGWCIHDTAVLQSADCDGDGILDLTCRDDDGRRWAITSSKGCDANTAIWDIVPPSACPMIFPPPTDPVPASCTRPSGWCIHNSSVLQSADCDGDGALDVTCRDDDGRRWAITSSTGCDANAAIWDIVPPSACPKIFSPPTDPASCTRPSGWCIHDTAVLQSADCDGDGILDLTCRDDDGRRWAITSSKGCDANTAIWDIVPPSACPMIFPPPTDPVPASCTRPSGWCIHNSSVLQSADCDGDGALDVTCRDDDGRRWAITSSTGCDANAAIWDIVPPSACPKIFSPPTDPASCTRPSGWCIHDTAVLQSADCDGDGILDLTCRDDDGRRWAITSSKGCDANTAIWDIVPPSACPMIFPPPTDPVPASCTRPSGWCIHNSSVLQSADCDGDGALDVTCRDDDGRRWAITSSTGCDANAAIWDIVPPSACPKIFSPPTDPASCTRPSGWCIHDTAVLQSADCDGDGILDLTCRDDDGRRWAITSSKGCDANTAIWDIVPPSACPMIFT
ncbi:hypothetical protein VOLCADRAFT_106028 [Volvox carteri f. nagariensis]|uniref:Uncharacterized protein n=1 Tax=Volvox carteri f. nagariensis TaxID=3068 RepID=D8U4M0_VOLCA|nr:uncharacterized protein VOLCADRAFT_106028 [Volvox carteri f. nagariensis]EFJ45297.1 hypothetical protein VOLCADRAFT_106028 [Volvox carteri f. nagariensis]|eukprot:XP_002953673.1 hypothetical protein VOLCADRAFT_106028 [Volvox carteri f. nagariensis]